MREGKEQGKMLVIGMLPNLKKNMKLPYKANTNCALPRFAPSISLPVLTGRLLLDKITPSEANTTTI